MNYKWVGGTLTNLNVRDRIESLDKYYKNCNKQLRNRRDFYLFVGMNCFEVCLV